MSAYSKGKRSDLGFQILLCLVSCVRELRKQHWREGAVHLSPENLTPLRQRYPVPQLGIVILGGRA